MAKTRGIAVDFVLELASLDRQQLAKLDAPDIHATLDNFVRAAQSIAHDHHLDEIDPWDEAGAPADSEGGTSD